MEATNFKSESNQYYLKRHEWDADTVIQELKEKMSRLKFRLLDCQNHNQMLRKELLLARKVVNAEVTPVPQDNFRELLDQASRTDFRGRREKILILNDRLSELQNRIKELEEANVNKSIEDFAVTPKEEKIEDREKYQSKKMMDKELQYLLENSCQLKRKLEVWKKRNAEVSKEVDLLRLELNTLLEKSKEDHSVHESYHVVEKELRATQTEKLDMRSKLDIEKSRNEKHVKEMAALREDISIILVKISDDKVLIEALKNQQDYLHDLLDHQKMLCENDNRRFRDDLREIQAKHATNCNTMYEFHDMVSEKNLMVQQLQEPMKQKGFLNGLETAEVLQESDAASTTANSEQSQQSELQQQPPSVNAEPSKPVGESPPEGDSEEVKLTQECEDYKNMLQSVNEEIERMRNAMSSNNAKLNEWMYQIFQTRFLLAEKSAEIRDLEEMIKKFQKAMSSSKKGGVSSPQHGANFVEELMKTNDVLSEEQVFLVSVWELLISNKENSMEIYTMSVDCTRNHFVDAINKLISAENVRNLDEQLPQVEEESQS